MIRHRAFITQADADGQWAGGVRIAPGIWQDAAGRIHWSVTELIALFALEDTPETRAQVVAFLAQIFEALGVDEVMQQEFTPDVERG